MKKEESLSKKQTNYSTQHERESGKERNAKVGTINPAVCAFVIGASDQSWLVETK